LEVREALAVKRRAFITLIGGAAAWPLAARAQLAAKPVVGVLYPGWPAALTHLIVAFRQGLNESGFVEGQNVTIEYRFAEGQYDRLPDLAADLVRQGVKVLVTATSSAARAAKAATTAIPVVFSVADDPVKLGLVASLNRPGGNVTGVNYFAWEIGTKSLGLLRELIPALVRVGILVNPNNSAGIETWMPDVMRAVSAAGLEIDLAKARDGREIEDAFATLVQNKPDALLVMTDPIFFLRRIQLATLAARHAIPTVYGLREFADAGGLISYGASLPDAHHQVGIYAGRILKGANPADLPVMQSTKFELVINLNTARALGLTVPATLLTIADEVID
jgi:putative tryptophan/tyrosine transport system substrate-binding protein